MKHAYADLMDGKFNKIIHQLTGYLRHQPNLITEMRTKCPKETKTRWTAMGNTCEWLLKKRVPISQYITNDDPSQAPPYWWWVVTAGVSAISEQVDIVVQKLQAGNLLISQQTQELDQLAVILSTHIEVEGPFTETESAALDTTYSRFGRWAIKHQNIINYLFDQGTFIQDTFVNKLTVESQVEVTILIGKLAMQIIDGITDIQVEHNSANRPTEALSPVLPHEIVKLRGRDFATIVLNHLDRLKQFWNEDLIAKLEYQHRQLLLAYQHDVTLKIALDKCDSTTSFETGWSIVEAKKFDVLRDFCGAIATVFPNNVSIEYAAANKSDEHLSSSAAKFSP